LEAKTAAQIAADNALEIANVYSTVAVGLAATTDGQYFSVPATDSQKFLSLYQNVSGEAVFIVSSYSSGKIDALEERQSINVSVTSAALAHIRSEYFREIYAMKESRIMESFAQAAAIVQLQAGFAQTHSFF